MNRRKFLKVFVSISGVIVGGYQILCRTVAYKRTMLFRSGGTEVGDQSVKKFGRDAVFNSIEKRLDSGVTLEDLREEFWTTIQKEYEMGDTVNIDGWIFSQTEAKIAGYRRLTVNDGSMRK